MKLIVFIIAIFAAQAACKEKKDTHMADHKLVVKIGEAGPTLHKRLGADVELDAHPSSVEFYRMRWDAKNSKTLTLQNGNQILILNNCLSFMGFQDNDFEAEGISQISINCALSASEFITHDEARLQFADRLKAAIDKGWQPLIPRNHPRIRGKDMFQYQFLSDTDISLDATYLPSLEEWMKIKNNKTWEFYSNRAFLEVSFSRHTSLPDVTRPDAYLVYYKFKSDNSYYRDYVPYERRKQWSSSLASALAPATAGRARREAAMRAKGISIDETYVDPPLPLEVTDAI